MLTSRSGIKAALGAILGLALIAAIVLGGWQAGWWFKTQNTNREARLYQHQYGRQTALRDEVSRKLGSITDLTAQLADPSLGPDQVAALGAQRLAIGRVVCQDAEQINKVTDLPPDQQQFVSLNCTNGDVSLSSPLRQN